MRMKNLNQKGITLIELLAVLTILGIVLGILYNVFINGLHYSTSSKDTVLIQQEANYLLTLLKKQHEKDVPYTVKIRKDNRSEVIIEGAELVNIENSSFEYSISDLGKSSVPCEDHEQYLFCKKVDPLNENFQLKIKVTSKKNSKMNFEVQTILSRL